MFWPINQKIYEFAPPFQWELNSWQNFIITLVLIFIIIVFALKKNRTIVEVFSIKWDYLVVDVLKKWFLKVK